MSSFRIASGATASETHSGHDSSPVQAVEPLARQHHTVEDTSPHEYPPVEEPGIDPLIMKLGRSVTQIRAIPRSWHRQNILS
jgi:hypothetical protein